MVTDGSASIRAALEVGSEGNVAGKAACRTTPLLRAASDEHAPFWKDTKNTRDKKHKKQTIISRKVMFAGLVVENGV